jgi:hypothetical protein
MRFGGFSIPSGRGWVRNEPFESSSTETHRDVSQRLTEDPNCEKLFQKHLQCSSL